MRWQPVVRSKSARKVRTRKRLEYIKMGVADEVRKRDVGAIRKRAEVDFHGFVKRFGFIMRCDQISSDEEDR